MQAGAQVGMGACKNTVSVGVGVSKVEDWGVLFFKMPLCLMCV